MELLKKLRLDNEKTLHLINTPDTVYSLFDSFTVMQKLAKEKPLVQVMLFAYNSAELAHYLHSWMAILTTRRCFGYSTLKRAALKREYVTAIVEARKPETRARRIDRMIGELMQKMHTRK